MIVLVVQETGDLNRIIEELTSSGCVLYTIILFSLSDQLAVVRE